MLSSNIPPITNSEGYARNMFISYFLPDRSGVKAVQSIDQAFRAWEILTRHLMFGTYLFSVDSKPFVCPLRSDSRQYEI